ncbi:hypothetical protein L686_16280 [Stutzerimonas stutzeri MF28]|nr:hypothetical protein L686_16280 [Stutzerimonas stutzeri MF28]
MNPWRWYGWRSRARPSRARGLLRQAPQSVGCTPRDQAPMAPSP